jgi:acetoin utilization deacetylase AcuC-like enzyme
VLRQFRPGLILISAGFDAHVDDPLGGMRVSTDQLGRLTALLADIGNECCEGRVVALTEGGYDLKALAGCLRNVTRVLAGEASTSDFPTPSGATSRADETMAAIRPFVGKFWKI